MSQASDPAAYVYEGFWFNWSKSSTQGLTLTLSPTNATLLTNSLALFVAMSGGQLWTIIRFVLHQTRSSPGSKSLDLLRYQQQVVLRNANTDLATIRLFSWLAWSSREKTFGIPSVSKFMIILLAMMHAIFFMAAGTLSNNFVKAGGTVLSRSPYCGFWNLTYFDTVEFINTTNDQFFEKSVEYLAKKEHDVQLSLQYAQNCYMSPVSSHLSSSCANAYQKSRLNWKTTFNDSCPFGETVCSQNAGTVTFDTGPIDSHDDLGINANREDRLTYRRLTKCTVLNDSSHTTGWISQTDSAGDPIPWDIAYAYYGPSLFEETNWTYSYSDFSSFYTNFSGQTTLPYQLGHAIAFGNSSTAEQSSTFMPSAEVSQSEADVILLFLSYIGKYTGRIQDPWFSANQVHYSDSDAPIARTTYVRDRPITTIGCTEQHEFCTIQGVCTPLLGFLQVQDSIASNINLTPHQNVTLDRVLRAVTASSIEEIVQGLAYTSSPLLATNQSVTESTTLSLALQDDQWQSELSFWHSIAMAQLQRKVVEWATGQIAPNTQDLVPPQTEPDAWFCQNLMLQSTAYQSFSVFALVLIFALGSLVILLSLTIENLTSWVQVRFLKGRGEAGRKMWAENDMLTLAYEQCTSAFGKQPLSQSRKTSFSDLVAPGKRNGQEIDLSKPLPQLPKHELPDGRISGLSRASSQTLSRADRARLLSSCDEKSPEALQTLIGGAADSNTMQSEGLASFYFDWKQPATVNSEAPTTDQKPAQNKSDYNGVGRMCYVSAQKRRHAQAPAHKTEASHLSHPDIPPQVDAPAYPEAVILRRDGLWI